MIAPARGRPEIEARLRRVRAWPGWRRGHQRALTRERVEQTDIENAVTDQQKCSVGAGHEKGRTIAACLLTQKIGFQERGELVLKHDRGKPVTCGHGDRGRPTMELSQQPKP